MSADSSPPPAVAATPAVLLVDDTPANLLAIDAVLRPLGVKLVHATSGAQALMLAAAESFAVVVLDVQMPEMNGFQVARRLRETAHGRDLPIIFLTAVYKDEAFLRQGYAVGAADYITKPFDVDVLRARVRAFVDLYRQRETVRGTQVRERTRERDDAVRRLVALERIATSVLETDNLPLLLRDLLAVFLGAADSADSAVILLRDGQQLRVAASAGAFGGPETMPLGTGLAGMIVGEGRPLHVKHPSRTADSLAGGRPFFGVPLVANGEVVGVASMKSGSAADFSDAERRVFVAMAERAAWAVSKHQERDHLQRVLTAAPAVIAMLKGRDHVCVFANRAAMGGRDEVDVLGRRAADLGATAEALCLMDEVLRTGESRVVDEFHTVTPWMVADASERYFRLSLQPTRSSSGTVDGVLVFAIDVTTEVRARRNLEVFATERARLLESERVARDAAESASRAKDEFLATVSHELRTPLNAILGWTVVARRMAAGSEVDRALATIERNAQAQTRIIDDVVDVSRMASGKLRIEIEPTDVRLAVEAAVQALRPAAEARGVALEVTIGENVDGILADAERLQQIVWNLLSNAIKFTPRGGKVVLATERLPESVVITVRDNGQGISRDFLAHIFEPFRQQEGGTTRRHGGLGLGLAIVQRLVHAHGGKIKAESDGEGSGATFTVELPSRPALPSSRRSRVDTPGPSAAPSAGPRLDGLTVLVVDDDVDGRELLAKVLGDQGAVVLSASSAPAALKVLEELRPDVVLSDVAMPEMDGYGLMRKLRRLPASRGGRTHSIALTAYARPEDAERAMSAGFDAYMSKPVHPGRLVNTIAELARAEQDKHDNVAVLRPVAGRGERTRR